MSYTCFCDAIASRQHGAAHTQTRTRAHTHTHTRTRVGAQTHAYINPYAEIVLQSAYLCVRVCMCAFVCVNMCVCVCMYPQGHYALCRPVRRPWTRSAADTTVLVWSAARVLGGHRPLGTGQYGCRHLAGRNTIPSTGMERHTHTHTHTHMINTHAHTHSFVRAAAPTCSHTKRTHIHTKQVLCARRLSVFCRVMSTHECQPRLWAYPS